MKTIPFFAISILLSYVSMAQANLSTDEKAIHQIVQDMQDGWNTKNGEQFAAHFADDHSYVVWNGMYLSKSDRAGNAQAHQRLFEGVYKTMYIDMKVDNVRFVKPDVAMVHTLINNRYGTDEAPNYPQLLLSMLMVKNGDSWEILSFHNLNIEYDQLLRKPEPNTEEIEAFAKVNYPGWYR